MAGLLGDVLLAIVRVVIWRWLSALALSALTWLDTKIPGRRMKIVVGGACGLAAFFWFRFLPGCWAFEDNEIQSDHRIGNRAVATSRRTRRRAASADIAEMAGK
ncbi:hypothetical protein ONR75_04200 [Rhodopseudomonas sp. P2A-2r]|uniref:hypothetical protein n=1 Tax=Rhodopseudomonas sp. P2A-2r TaxID=2991972 RepID=UPI002234E0F7|nr:hypothetical protein [Rhodopseudomonas sp. P2A-2r]UZE49986.1 hypothetical protein ONR75_04200 [Rhodopseudomonas sp. P2A-2r]